jgi:NTE family protein
MSEGDLSAPPVRSVKHERAQKTALVLSGGGARGAYEAGVLRYIRDELPPRVRARVRFEIICGTSVGAINACFLAATAHVPEVQGRALSDVWTRLRIEGVYQIGFRELLNLPRFLFGSRGRGNPDDVVGVGRLGGFLNTSPLEQLVKRGTRWAQISENIDAGSLEALCINATHLASGTTHSFIQRAGDMLPWSTDPQIIARKATIGPEHALASAAIPWVFPCVDIGGQVYADGGLKLNTPISPAIRLGAERLLVIGLRSEEENKAPSMDSVDTVDQSPSAGFILGKIMNAFLSDKTEYDLQRVNRLNELLAAGERAYGSGFADTLSSAMKKSRGQPYKRVETLMIRPNEDMASVATEHVRRGTVVHRAGPAVGAMLKRAAGSDLLSYLLFDGEYAKDLVAMGMRDADARRASLISFFSV